MTLREKIEEISLDDKQREQIEAMFGIAFAAGAQYRDVIGSLPSGKQFPAIVYDFLRVRDNELIDVFNEYMRDYEKEVSRKKEGDTN